MIYKGTQIRHISDVIHQKYFSEFNLLNHLDLEYFSNKKHLEIFRSFIFLQLHLFHSTSFNCLNVARYKFGAVGRILSNKNSLIEQFYFFELRKFSGKIFIFPFRKLLEKIKIHLLQRIHGGTFGNESLLKKTAAERQLQRLRKRKESTSSTTAQQSRRMDASTQTIVRLTLVASPLELKTPSYKLLLIVKVQLRPYLLNYWEGKLKKCHILKVDERNYFGADLSHISRIKKLEKCHILKVDERNYFGADLSHILRIKKLKKCHIVKVVERNYFGADLSHILRIKKLKKCHILKVDERNYFGADLSHIYIRILLGREEPYIEKKIIVNLLGQKEPYIVKKIIVNLLGQKEPCIVKNNCEFYWAEKSRKEVLSEINVKLKIEKNNKFLIINEYKNKFMNKEEENIYSENESNSSEEETDKTNTTETQAGLNKNIEVEKLVEISINTKEDSDSTQRINKEKPKEKTINDKIVTTIGKIIIILLLNNNKIKTEFHVVDKEFPIPRDGILGHHFLLQNNAIIDKQELIQEQRIELNVIKESDL
ncbi:hypothetical protein AGLY_003074 [Aphis glycines]|uniref:Uncharacterized protein n=1 Tax=Aphis glycines TaxID=307491 RepID=A0A6G0U2K0_APHGL|nr:hypothetical protein AGLY_003074 [Aphis glycines]